MKKSPERDESIERLLRQWSRPTPDGAATESCLDTETLAAWADHGLSGTALELAESHVADCARCQALVGTLVRFNAAAPATKSAPAARGWIPWLAPLTAAVAALMAVALWVAIPRRSDVAPTPREEKATATVPVSGAATDRSVEERPAAGSNERPAQPDPGAAAAANARSSMALDSAAAAKELARAKASPSTQADAQASELRKDTGQLAAANSNQPQAPLASAAASPAPAVAAAAAVRSAPAAAVDQVAAGKTNAGFGETAGSEIRSPDPAVRWRIRGSAVQRSTDGGSSWRDVSTGFQGQLTAGAAPSPAVCWLVGRGGFMLLASVTNSGVSWRRISFPEPADLAAVRATDALTASVTSVDGRTFTTTDGGATWVRVTPQGF